MNAIRIRVSLNADYTGNFRHLNQHVLAVKSLLGSAVAVHGYDNAIFHDSQFTFLDEHDQPLTKLIVNLSNCGNPDYGQDERKPLHGTFNTMLLVPSLDVAKVMCREYIRHHGLGGGNWSGGQVYLADSLIQVAQISYNGRAWDLENHCIDELTADVLAIARQERKEFVAA